MKIFTKIKDSIYNPEYYKEVLQKPFSYSVKYFLLFALLFALVFSVVVTIKFIPIVGLMSLKAPELANYFPQELTLTIKDGKASTNVSEPYFIKMPKAISDNKSFDNEDMMINGNDVKDIIRLENIVVIDTKNKFDIDRFESYKTAILITEDNIISLENGKVSIVSVSEVPDFVLNREKISSIVEKVKPFLVYLYPIVFVGGLIGGYFMMLGKIFYLIFGALLIWATIAVMGLKIGYKKSYQLGLHLMTLPIIVIGILTIIPFNIIFPFLFSIILVLATAYNLRKNSLQTITAN